MHGRPGETSLSKIPSARPSLSEARIIAPKGRSIRFPWARIRSIFKTLPTKNWLIAAWLKGHFAFFVALTAYCLMQRWFWAVPSAKAALPSKTLSGVLFITISSLFIISAESHILVVNTKWAALYALKMRKAIGPVHTTRLNMEATNFVLVQGTTTMAY